MSIPDSLQQWLLDHPTATKTAGDNKPTDLGVSKLPTPEEVLYEPANQGDDRKRCGNCWKWVKENRCLEVAGVVKSGQVCGLHVTGSPQARELALGARKMDPMRAGLITIAGGTSCDTCSAYVKIDEKTGTCKATQKNGMHPDVQARGCCARWRKS